MQEENNPYIADGFSYVHAFCVYQSIKIPVQEYFRRKCASVTPVTAMPATVGSGENALCVLSSLGRHASQPGRKQVAGTTQQPGQETAWRSMVMQPR